MLTKYQLLIDKAIENKNNPDACNQAADALIVQLLTDFPRPNYWPEDAEWDLTTPSKLQEETTIINKLLYTESDNNCWNDWPNNVPEEYLSENVLPITIFKYMLSPCRLPIDVEYSENFSKFAEQYRLMIHNASYLTFPKKKS
jgi:hypothetical protein